MDGVINSLSECKFTKNSVANNIYAIYFSIFCANKVIIPYFYHIIPSFLLRFPIKKMDSIKTLPIYKYTTFY